MRRTVSHLLAALLLIGGAPLGNADETAVAPARGKVLGYQISKHPEWFRESFLEIAEDAADAVREGKHFIVFFDSEGCPYCYKMIEENFKHSSYTNFIQTNFHAIPINIRGDREIGFS